MFSSCGFGLQKVRGRKATSNPTSPLTEPRHHSSAPDPRTCQHAEVALHHSLIGHCADHDEHVTSCRHSQEHHYIDHIATVRAKRNRAPHTAQPHFDDAPPSSGVTRRMRVECDGECPHNTNTQTTPRTKYRPIGEREIPYSEYIDGAPPRNDVIDVLQNVVEAAVLSEKVEVFVAVLVEPQSERITGDVAIDGVDDVRDAEAVQQICVLGVLFRANVQEVKQPRWI